jgi:catechol 2,3-dioxygenase-like lactoylglutathione lyase family enzyme
MTSYPELMHTVIDTTDARMLAEFYRQLLGLRYREGEVDADWVVLVNAMGSEVLAFQEVPELHRTTWPTAEVPTQMHLDLSVASKAELRHQRERAESLGAVLLLDRGDDLDEPLYVFADPSGHPFCILVA